jgi:hypothetical protein
MSKKGPLEPKPAQLISKPISIPASAGRNTSTMSHAHFDLAHVFDRRRERFETVAASRDQNYVDPALCNAPGELSTNSRGSAGDDGPGSVPLGKLTHGRAAYHAAR